MTEEKTCQHPAFAIWPQTFLKKVSCTACGEQIDIALVLSRISWRLENAEFRIEELTKKLKGGQ